MELAELVRDATEFARAARLTIAIMGCRVNGPGEVYDADLGLWCGPKMVNLLQKDRLIGQFDYDKIIPRFLEEFDSLLKTA